MSTDFVQLRAAIKQELAETSMEPWAAELCRFVARQADLSKYRVGDTLRKPFMDAASAMAERPIKRAELAQIIRTRPWMTLWEKERGNLVDHEVKQAKEGFMRLVPKAILVANQSLDVVEETLKSEEEGVDKIGAVRAISPLVGKVLDVSIPKSQVGTTLNAQVVNIHITQEQAAAFEAPALAVEAEVISIEPLDPPPLLSA